MLKKSEKEEEEKTSTNQEIPGNYPIRRSRSVLTEKPVGTVDAIEKNKATVNYGCLPLK
jgi:hypothetical protein